MSLDRFKSAPGVMSLNPEPTQTDGFPGALMIGGIAGFAGGLLANTGGALIQTPFTRSGAVPTLASSGNLNHQNCGVLIFTTGGAVTGIIVQAGTYHGQMLVLVNTSANTATMAAAGTSRVAAGTSAIVPALGALQLTWNALDGRWYDVG